MLLVEALSCGGTILGASETLLRCSSYTPYTPMGAGNYGPPPGFNWDWGQGDPQIQVRLWAFRGGHHLHTSCWHCCTHDVLLSQGIHAAQTLVSWLERASDLHRGLPMQDDPRLHDVNVKDRVDTFVKECDAIFNVTHGDDIMLTMGTDFTVPLRCKPVAVLHDCAPLFKMHPFLALCSYQSTCMILKLGDADTLDHL